jgi:hypothetical protein
MRTELRNKYVIVCVRGYGFFICGKYIETSFGYVQLHNHGHVYDYNSKTPDVEIYGKIINIKETEIIWMAEFDLPEENHA